MLVVSPAHWAKFPADVMRGLSGFPADHPMPQDDFQLLEEVERLAPGSPVPSVVHDMRSRPVRFTERVGGDQGSLEKALRAWLSQEA
jgi:hypothetical protein